MADDKFLDSLNKSFDAVKEAVSDPLISAKLNFALSLSKQVTLSRCSIKLISQFCCVLADDLFTLIKDVMLKFLKKEVMEKVTSVKKLIKVNISDKESQLL